MAPCLFAYVDVRCLSCTLISRSTSELCSCWIKTSEHCPQHLQLGFLFKLSFNVDVRSTGGLVRLVGTCGHNTTFNLRHPSDGPSLRAGPKRPTGTMQGFGADIMCSKPVTACSSAMVINRGRGYGRHKPGLGTLKGFGAHTRTIQVRHVARGF